MRHSSLTLIAAAVLAGGSFGFLTGCSEAPADEQVVSPAPAQSPEDQPLPPVTASTERAPLGFEVRYVDADGKFRTVTPENFPR